MADIFGSTQLPPWMQTGTGVDIVNRGQKAYQDSLRNFSDVAAQQQDIQQKKALLPLILQQQQNQIESQSLDIAQKQFDTQNMLGAQDGIVKMLDSMSKITNWADPKSLNPVLEVARDNPKVLLTQKGMQILNFAKQQQDVAMRSSNMLNATQIKANRSPQVANDNHLQALKDGLDNAQTQEEADAWQSQIDAFTKAISPKPQAVNRPPAATGNFNTLQGLNAALDAAKASGDQDAIAKAQKDVDQFSSMPGVASKVKPAGPVTFDATTGTPVGNANVKLTSNNTTINRNILRNADIARQQVDKLMGEINNSDIGMVGAATSAVGKLIGTVVPGVGGGTSTDVQQDLGALANTMQSMKSADRRGSVAELREMEKLIPARGFKIESSGNAARMLNGLVNNVLIPNARANAETIGTLPPVWAMSPPEVLQAANAGAAAVQNGLAPTDPQFSQKFLTPTQAKKILDYFKAKGTMPLRIPD